MRELQTAQSFLPRVPHGSGSPGKDGLSWPAAALGRVRVSILLSSRDKNMMKASWGAERRAAGTMEFRVVMVSVAGTGVSEIS